MLTHANLAVRGEHLGAACATRPGRSRLRRAADLPRLRARLDAARQLRAAAHACRSWRASIRSARSTRSRTTASRSSRACRRCTRACSSSCPRARARARRACATSTPAARRSIRRSRREVEARFGCAAAQRLRAHRVLADRVADAARGAARRTRRWAADPRHRGAHRRRRRERRRAGRGRRTVGARAERDEGLLPRSAGDRRGDHRGRVAQDRRPRAARGRRRAVHRRPLART